MKPLTDEEVAEMFPVLRRAKPAKISQKPKSNTRFYDSKELDRTARRVVWHHWHMTLEKFRNSILRVRLRMEGWNAQQ